MSILLNLVTAVVFIALVCFLTYKTVLPVCLKIIDQSIKSPVFRKCLCILLALAFGVVGTFQLIDFFHETLQSMSKFFPLSFLSSAIFLYLFFARSKTHS